MEAVLLLRQVLLDLLPLSPRHCPSAAFLPLPPSAPPSSLLFPPPSSLLLPRSARTKGAEFSLGGGFVGGGYGRMPGSYGGGMGGGGYGGGMGDQLDEDLRTMVDSLLKPLHAKPPFTLAA